MPRKKKNVTMPHQKGSHRGSAGAWQIQEWMLTGIHWMEHRVSNEGARERTQRAEGVCSPIGRTTTGTNQYPQSSQGLNHQPKKSHGGTHGSSCIWSRGWSSQSSMGGEALGPVKVLCPIIGECQDQEWEWEGWWTREGGRDRGVLEGKLGKGITFEM